MPGVTTTVGLLGDHVLYRKVLRDYLSRQQGIAHVIDSSQTEELLSTIRSSPIDILVIDLTLPLQRATEELATIRREHPAVKVLILSMSEDLHMIHELLGFGINGYVSKKTGPEELVEAISSISVNGVYRNNLFTEALYHSQQSSRHGRDEQPPHILNDREKKILQLIWEEKSNKEIADEFFLGVRSVEKIRQDMKEKLGIRSTVGLLKYAISKQIITSNLRRLDWGR